MRADIRSTWIVFSLCSAWLGAGCVEQPAPAAERVGAVVSALGEHEHDASTGTCSSGATPSIEPDQHDYFPPVDVHLFASGLECGASYSVRIITPEQLWPVFIPGGQIIDLPAQTADEHGEIEFVYFLSEEIAGDWQVELLDAEGHEVAHTHFHDSHFRYSHLTWTQSGAPSARTAAFKLTIGFRGSAYPCSGTLNCSNGVRTVGSVLLPAQAQFVLPRIFFGDGASTPDLGFVVTAYDAANDWLIGEALAPGSSTSTTIKYTYPNNGVNAFTAYMQGQARLSTIRNAADGTYRNETIVRFDVVNSSPVSTLPPIINAPANAPAFTFTVPRADVDGDVTTCRFATCAEAYATASCQTPPGMTINPTTCVVTWNTNGQGVGWLWTTQVMIESRRSNVLIDKVGVDFILQIVAADPNPPRCTLTPSANPHLLTPGVETVITLDATDPSPSGDTLRINAFGMPSGATMTPSLPLEAAAPVSTVFRWTPTVAQAGSTHVTSFTVTDRVGLQTACSMTLRVQSPPVVTVPGNITTCPTSPAGASVTYAASAVDGLGNPLTPTCTPASGSTFPVGATTVTCQATDSVGLTGSASFVVNVPADAQPPSITCPADADVACGADTSPAATGTATGSDNCGTPTIDYEDTDEPACGLTHTVFRTWAATDAVGNSQSCVQRVATSDGVAPSVTAPADTSVECGQSTEPAATGSATASDACGDVTVGSSDDFAAGCRGTGVITRTFAAEDACGNDGTDTQTITIVDTTPPAVSCPPVAPVECTSPDGAVATFSATAHDSCAPGAMASCPGSGGTFPLGATTVSCTGVDSCGNDASCTATVEVIDTTLPSITCPAAAVAECTGDHQASVSPGAAFALDLCGGVTVNGPAAGNYPLGTTATSYSATDLSGNAASCSSSVSVVDTSVPSISCPADVTAECNAAGSATGTSAGAASASDVCGGVSVAEPAAATYPLGTTHVTHTATDEAGLAASCQNRVTVVDTTAPSLACPADVTVECNAPGAATSVSAGAATASDVCTSATVVDPAVATYPLGATTASHSATDLAGNATSCSNTVRVVDTTPPVFDAASLSARTVVGDCSGAPISVALPTATDLCQSATVSCAALPASSFGANTVTCTATDTSGNQATASLAVNVIQPLRVAFQQPLSDDNVADDIHTDADARNVFQVKSTIPNHVKLLDCAGVDVTSSVAVDVRLTVSLRSGESDVIGTNVVPAYVGVGDAGGVMVLVDGKYKYNLKTNGYVAGTANAGDPRFYDAVVTVTYSSSPSFVVGREDARLESK